MTVGARGKAGFVVVMAAWVLSVTLVAGQGAQTQKPQLSEQVFKNVQVLRGISADEFLGTMGVFSAALGVSCENCHGAETTWAGYATDASAMKQTTRRMVIMMQAINQANFGGRQLVTCMTCHRGAQAPMSTPSLNVLYGQPPPPDDAEIFQQAPGAPTPDQVFDKYVAALGGAQRVNGFTSFVGKGQSLGYGPEGQRPFDVYAKAPGQRALVFHTENGDTTYVYNGQTGIEASALGAVALLEVTGQTLGGLKVETELLFPARIKQLLTNPRVGFPAAIGDRDVVPVQGTAPGGGVVNLFFDAETGLLLRILRFADSPVGRLSTKVDLEDYRDVSGIKFPFKQTLWRMNGKEEMEFTDVQVNANVDASRFATPKPSPRAGR